MVSRSGIRGYIQKTNFTKSYKNRTFLERYDRLRLEGTRYCKFLPGSMGINILKISVVHLGDLSNPEVFMVRHFLFFLSFAARGYSLDRHFLYILILL